MGLISYVKVSNVCLCLKCKCLLSVKDNKWYWLNKRIFFYFCTYLLQCHQDVIETELLSIIWSIPYEILHSIWVSHILCELVCWQFSLHTKSTVELLAGSHLSHMGKAQDAHEIILTVVMFYINQTSTKYTQWYDFLFNCNT